MEEKIIIKSKRARFKAVYCVLFAVAILVVGIILYFLNIGNSRGPNYWGRYWTIWDNMLDPFSFIPGLLVDIGLIVLVVAAFIVWMLSSDEITITDKRVYGKSHFGKRVDLPLDMISAVGTSILKGLTVATASGVIKFALLENRDELHEEISKLLLKRQTQQKQNVIKQEIPQSNADELKKYKDLLDSGIISQEEFDAKKKQLLGL